MPDLSADRFAPLRQRFRLRVAGDEARLRVLAMESDANAGAEVMDIAHKLAGLAGTLGFAELSCLAKQLERRLLEGGGAMDGNALPELDTLLAAMSQCANEAG